MKKAIKYKSLIKYILFLYLVFCGNYKILILAESNQNNYLKKEYAISSKLNNSDETPYLLDSGDSLYINFFDLPLFSKIYIIDSNGKINLPDIGEIDVRGKDLIELSAILKKQYKDILINPKLHVTIIRNRPVTVFLGGEILRPGIYTLTYTRDPSPAGATKGLNISNDINVYNDSPSSSDIAPKLFDAIKEGIGITEYADLKNIQVIRNQSERLGGGKIKANINLYNLITKGDQSQNISLRDGDKIMISRSKKIIREQLLAINKTNLTPDQIKVFVNGNISRQGEISLPHGYSLYDAIASAGGHLSNTGYIEFIRFNESGGTKKDLLRLNPKAIKGSKNNPYLIDGDIIVLRKNILGKTSDFLKELSAPVVTSYGLYNIFK